MTYSLATIAAPGSNILAIDHNGRFYDLLRLVPELRADPSRGLLDVFEDWATAEPLIDAAAGRLSEAEAIASPRPDEILAPILYPSKIVCTGTNYYDHLRIDFNTPDFDKTKYDILYFLKHSRALVGSGGSVRYPSQSKQLDWEVELVAVIGKQGRRIAPEQALEHIAGYSIGLDLSARDLQFNPRHRKQFDLFGGKSFDDSSPMGPGIVPARFVDPAGLWLELWVNGEIKQNSTTKEMIWSMAEQIAEASQHMTLEPGDVVYTGSPASIGMVSKTFLKEGDEIVAEIEGLGRLEVSIVSDPDAAVAHAFS